jgi:hypothetical protein
MKLDINNQEMQIKVKEDSMFVTDDLGNEYKLVKYIKPNEVIKE